MHTFTHPDFPRLAVRVTELVNGTWRRELAIDDQVAWSKEFPDVAQYTGDARYQASQGALWVAIWGDKGSHPLDQSRDFGEPIMGMLGDIETLGYHIANSRAITSS